MAKKRKIIHVDTVHKGPDDQVSVKNQEFNTARKIPRTTQTTYAKLPEDLHIQPPPQPNESTSTPSERLLKKEEPKKKTQACL